MKKLTTKICSKCKEEKELNDFAKRWEAPDGHRGVCKACKWKPRERKLKFCEGCGVELGRETIRKLCDPCKTNNKIKAGKEGNKKASLLKEVNAIKRAQEELEFILNNDTNEEIWKDIPKYEGKYQASNLGRIRCLPHTFRNKKGKLISSPFYYVSLRDNRGYLQVTLRDFEGNNKHRGVHRWVMFAFHGESDLQVDHINGIKDDNRLVNLRYVTARENISYRKDINPDFFTSALYGTYEQRGLYYSYIKIDGVEYYLGSYKVELEAHTVYMKAWKDWDELGKLPEKWVNPNKTSQIDGIDFHTASNKWRVRLKDVGEYIGIFETEDIALRVKNLVEYMILRGVIINKTLIKKIREKYGKDNRFKTFVVHTETGEVYKSISATAKAHHISPTRLRKHLDGEIITDLKFKYKNANTTT